MKEQEAMLMAKYGGMKPKKKPGFATKVRATAFSMSFQVHVFRVPEMQIVIDSSLDIRRNTNFSTLLTGPSTRNKARAELLRDSQLPPLSCRLR